MQDRAALLHAAIVPAADDFAVDHQHRADRDAALGETHAGFLDRHFHEFVHADHSLMQVLRYELP